MPGGHFLSWVTKNRAAYREQRPLANYAEVARGRPQVKVNKEVTGNRFRLVEARAPAGLLKSKRDIPGSAMSTRFRRCFRVRRKSGLQNRACRSLPQPRPAEARKIDRFRDLYVPRRLCPVFNLQFIIMIFRCQAGATPGVRLKNQCPTIQSIVGH